MTYVHGLRVTIKAVGTDAFLLENLHHGKNSHGLVGTVRFPKVALD